eukprot:gene32299-37694_t
MPPRWEAGLRSIGLVELQFLDDINEDDLRELDPPMLRLQRRRLLCAIAAPAAAAAAPPARPPAAAGAAGMEVKVKLEPAEGRG